jgi:two-component system, NarL family, invasion response regulator UvrY
MIRIFVADDHKVIRDGLKLIFSQTDDLQVCGDADNAEEVIRRAGQEQWDVLILDIDMPGCGGLEAIDRLKAIAPELKVVVFTMYDERSYAQTMFRAGADAFMSKDRSPEELIEAIRKVNQGGRYITASLAEYLLESDSKVQSVPHLALSKRELNILLLLAKGVAQKEIAGNLNVSASTVASHVQNIKRKLGFATTGEAIQYAHVHGLVK